MGLDELRALNAAILRLNGSKTWSPRTDANTYVISPKTDLEKAHTASRVYRRTRLERFQRRSKFDKLDAVSNTGELFFDDVEVLRTTSSAC